MYTKPGTELQFSQHLFLWLLFLFNQPPLEKRRQRREGTPSSRLTEHKEEMRTPGSSVCIHSPPGWGWFWGLRREIPQGCSPHFVSTTSSLWHRAPGRGAQCWLRRVAQDQPWMHSKSGISESRSCEKGEIRGGWREGRTDYFVSTSVSPRRMCP